ncbi:hypothetical protein SCHPADRAFT_908362 [Schizopora paradoxa]|uniref:DUF6533 domain-containing protein n=1 Tax=Schizopora paradoxa TaxID=27342 RepID=A0A0H2RBG6_9AGAM|nr:hypothetical protein SCHPADRAFT_908362 [Schizopora paradoxa]
MYYIPTTLHEIVQAADYEVVFHYLLVSTLSMLFTEYIVTIQEEVHFIWDSRFGLVKSLYLLNRYIPPMNVLYSLYVFIFTEKTGETLCRKEFIIMGSVTYLQFAIAYAVLCVRAYAVWSSVKSVLLLLVGLFITSITVEAYVVGNYFAGSLAFNLGSGVPGCLILLTNNKMWIALVVIVCSDAVTLALLLIKSVTSSRSSRSGLLTVMVRDGIGYFVCVMGLSIANMIVLRTVAPMMRDLYILPQASLQNVLCVRLLLHLHVVNDRESNLSTSDMTLVELKDSRQTRRRPAGMTDTYSSCTDSIVYVAPFAAHHD